MIEGWETTNALSFFFSQQMKKWAQSNNILVTVSCDIHGGAVEEETRSTFWPHCS